MQTIDRIDQATQVVVSHLREATAVAAYLVLCMLTVEAKVLLGRQLGRLTGHLQGLMARRDQLLLPAIPDWSEKLAHSLKSGAEGGADASIVLGRLARIYSDVMAASRLDGHTRMDQVLDEPTLRIFSLLHDEFSEMLEQARFFASSDAARLERPGSFSDADVLPCLPGRDERFKIGDSREHCGATAPMHPRGAQFHGMLMSIEIPTIEACAENILEAEGLPLDFLSDMGRQAYDEARHAQALVDWLEMRSIGLGSYYVSYDLWRLTRGRNLLQRLCIHQRLGETIGASAAHWWANQFASLGESEESDMYQIMYRDEVQHVAIGNRWIRALCQHDDAVVASNVQSAQAARQEYQSAQGVVNGQRSYPLPVHALSAAGYTPDEISAMTGGPDK